MRARYTEHGGYRTRALEAGAGEPILLLHPVGFSADVWFRNLPALGRHGLACAPDLLGHGFSDLFGRDGHIDHGAIVDQLESYVRARGWDRYAVVGSSFGAQLAAQLALRQPAQVRRLVIVGSGTALQAEAATAATLGKTLANASRAFDDPTWDSCRQRLANLCFDPSGRHDEVLLGQLTAYARPDAARAYRELLEAMLDADRARPWRVRERLGEIRMPTLVVWGRQDPRSSYEHAQEAVALIPQASLVGFDACGHLPFLEHPVRFNRLVGEFLAG